MAIMLVKSRDIGPHYYETLFLRSSINPEQWSDESVRHGEEVTLLAKVAAEDDSTGGQTEFVLVRGASGAQGWVKAEFLEPTTAAMVVKCRDIAPRFDEAIFLRAQLNPDLWSQATVRDGEVVTAVTVARSPGLEGQLEDFVFIVTADGTEGWVKRKFLQPAVGKE
eukprot:CAMPEP_0204137240 /NCGR_PEP_ID=MMETSP0361-20130328/17288_1 /ASSEMBLY_ACC=CAM_ASM_000343 /TAXON_ID=268821 /ORGANISM="Scrippsiella Hangoei, Strain SHTV-5" /LENGTH=165 /DNA_ID=CAMNT_0051090871 /DNA_START=63 /DNA_END=560 /DNA_ORIENTATION=-